MSPLLWLGLGALGLGAVAVLSKPQTPSVPTVQYNGPGGSASVTPNSLSLTPSDPSQPALQATLEAGQGANTGAEAVEDILSAMGPIRLHYRPMRVRY